MEEKDFPTGAPHSWLTNFLVDAHLSAPSRRWEANSNTAPNTLIGSSDNPHSDTIAGLDRA